MKLNYETCILGQACILVPYRREHVPIYHEWMKDPDLLEATGSEPLSLEEEYEMQQSWRDDAHKMTFIILDKEQATKGTIKDQDNDFIVRNLDAMVGDVNLFLSEEDNEDQDETNDNNQLLQAELDIMVAEKTARGKGIGREACCLMMKFGASRLNIRRFFCKINEDNEASLAMFRKLGFHQCAYAECFKQIELELKRNSSKEVCQFLSYRLGTDSIKTLHCSALDMH